MDEDSLIAFVQAYEPVWDMRPPNESFTQCQTGCGRSVAQGVSLCVRCRNASQHPAHWGKRLA